MKSVAPKIEKKISFFKIVAFDVILSTYIVHDLDDGVFVLLDKACI